MGQHDLAERIICSTKGRCSGREQCHFADVPSVSFVGESFLLLLKCDGFKAENYEYNLGFKDYVRAIISSDLKKIPGFQFSDFEGVLLPHICPFYNSYHLALICVS